MKVLFGLELPSRLGVMWCRCKLILRQVLGLWQVLSRGLLQAGV